MSPVYLHNAATGAKFSFASQADADAFLDRVAAEPAAWSRTDDNTDAVPYVGSV